MYDNISRRYFWTFDYIDTLPYQTIRMISALIEAETRHHNMMKNKGRNKNRFRRGRR